MSVLVKGMKMPESCNVCEFAHWSTLDQMAYCKAKNYTMCPPDYRTKRADFCQLVALPDKHGDLIDKGKLLRDIEKYHLSVGKFQHWVEVQNTIVEAEGEE